MKRNGDRNLSFFLLKKKLNWFSGFWWPEPVLKSAIFYLLGSHKRSQRSKISLPNGNDILHIFDETSWRS